MDRFSGAPTVVPPRCEKSVLLWYTNKRTLSSPPASHLYTPSFSPEIRDAEEESPPIVEEHEMGF